MFLFSVAEVEVERKLDGAIRNENVSELRTAKQCWK